MLFVIVRRNEFFLIISRELTYFEI